MDITTASLIELKAAVYDELAAIENAQKNIQILNVEITKRQQAAPQPPAPPTEDTEHDR